MSNTQYVDGFVIPVPKDKIEEYKKVAEVASQVWMELGALDYRECVADDTNSEFGIPFPKLANCSPEETVVFSWITYESKEKRDEVNAKVMEDPRMKEMMASCEQVFDCKRMSYGGFTTLVKA